MYLCQKYCFSTDDYVAKWPNHDAEFQLLFNKISVNNSIDKYHDAENFLASSSQY